MKRGFTLVELLSVIVIIAVISMVTFPIITDYINKSKESLYLSQVADIELAASKWALDNTDKLDKYHINDIVVTIKLLQQLEYLEKDEILSPKTKEEMRGFILIKYDSDAKTYSYKYYSEYLDELANPAIDSKLSNSYIMYLYNFGHEENSKLDITRTILDYSNTSFYLDILKNNQLHVVGETKDGLYETENEYVFKGSNVSNYVKYGGNTWRILSINKNDYSMKLMSTSINDSNTWSSSNEKTVDFKKSNFQKSETEYLKVRDTWYNGLVQNVPNSVTGLRGNIIMNEITSKEGMISVYDYVAATHSNNCDNNFLSAECRNSNYIYNLYSGKSVWTMNNDGNQIWYINQEGILSLADSTSGPYYYSKVIKLPISAYCINRDTATGSEIQFAYEIY